MNSGPDSQVAARFLIPFEAESLASKHRPGHGH
jgi:hypothetical protein